MHSIVLGYNDILGCYVVDYSEALTEDFLDESKILETHVGSKTASNDDTQQHHDLLPPRLLLILQSLLGVVGSSGGVLHCTLNMSINPVDHLSLILNENRDIHEHLVQLLDRGLQLDEHLVSLFNIIESLSELSSVSFYLNVTSQSGSSSSLIMKRL